MNFSVAEHPLAHQFGGHDGAEVGVRARDCGKDRCVDDAESLGSEHLAVDVDYSRFVRFAAHTAGARAVLRVDDAVEQEIVHGATSEGCEELGIRLLNWLGEQLREGIVRAELCKHSGTVCESAKVALVTQHIFAYERLLARVR